MAKCQCITVRGTRCKFNAKEGSKYCARHMKKCSPRKTKSTGQKAKPSAKVSSSKGKTKSTTAGRKSKIFRYVPPKHAPLKAESIPVEFEGEIYRIKVHPLDTLDQIEKALKKSFGTGNKKTVLKVADDNVLVWGQFHRDKPILYMNEANQRLRKGLLFSVYKHIPYRKYRV